MSWRKVRMPIAHGAALLGGLLAAMALVVYGLGRSGDAKGAGDLLGSLAGLCLLIAIGAMLATSDIAKATGKWWRTVRWPLVSVVAIAITGAVGSGVIQAPRIAAEDACRDLIEGQLKAPSQADIEISSKRTSEGWKVFGRYDSPNDFGTMKRGYFSCSTDDEIATLTFMN